ncbi:MAG: polysaccharide deacetylase [Lachnospiraceae bacterium]|nr:polysaccharide deacetylase [Lachnospiraceae bacterium]
MMDYYSGSPSRHSNRRSSIRKSNYSFRRRRRQHNRIPILLLILLLVAVVGYGVFICIRQFQKMRPEKTPGSQSGVTVSGSVNGSSGSPTDPSVSDPLDPGQETSSSSTVSSTSLLEQANFIAAGYDYDKAIELLKGASDYDQHPEYLEAVTSYEQAKETLVPYDLNKITHVFFHTLIMDEDKAFDGDSDERGYNQVMTTADEFLKILQSMYDKGFVLVRLHDIAYETTDENGQAVLKKGEILLPEGKQAFVMSQDDVCYYEYMDGDGFASRMVIGADGKPTCEMKLDDGTISTGSYDLVPLLEDFIQEHPDFSYRGARAVIAFTGYQGILGYRTAASYSDSPTYEEDRQTASAVAQCLRDNGWELASHSWGHRDLGNIEYAHFKTDCDKWENEVESLIGPTDIILFPFGADVGDWHPYSSDNDRFNYLHSLGFRYFCNVDSTQYWVQFGKDYLRQGRRNLDGYRMWKDIEAGDDTSKRKLDDLFKAEDVFSSKRPTPVQWN